MISLPQALSRFRHDEWIQSKESTERRPSDIQPDPIPMSELARQLIRQQWPLRNHPDPLRRAQSRSLIRTHIHLLRTWSHSPSMAR